MTTTTPAVGTDALYEHLTEVSATLYKKALTDLPPDVRSAVSRVHDLEEGSARDVWR